MSYSELEQTQNSLLVERHTRRLHERTIRELRDYVDEMKVALIECGNLGANVRFIHNFEEACAELNRRAAIAQRALKGTKPGETKMALIDIGEGVKINPEHIVTLRRSGNGPDLFVLTTSGHEFTCNDPDRALERKIEDAMGTQGASAW